MRSIIANILVIAGLAAIVVAAVRWNVTGGLAVGGVVAVAVGCGLSATGKRTGP